MTLLDATATLIDAVKTYAPEEDATIRRALKRAEKRLRLLQLRKAKATRRHRKMAWHMVRIAIKATCPGCGFVFDFGSFIKNVEFNGHGDINGLHCPECDDHIMGYRGKCSVCKERL